MREQSINARWDRFPLPAGTAANETVVVPTVKGTCKMKYGEHAYYFMDLGTSKGWRVRIQHRDIMGPGVARLQRAAARHGKRVSVWHGLKADFHYGFSLLEQLMLMTVPHAVTPLGAGRFIINLWSYCGFLVVDCRARTVVYHILDAGDDDRVLGSQQWYDPASSELYGMSYSLDDSLARIAKPARPVACRIFKRRLGAQDTTLWEGPLSDYLHDIVVNQTRRYAVACELGMYRDAEGEMLPSQVLVLDLQHGRYWLLDRFMVAAHACFDPVEPNIVYFSNHNFQFEHSRLPALLKRGSYAMTFRGPASVFKYELTPEGPRELGVFTREDFYRLTNMHVFLHRGRRLMVAMGYPDELFLVNPDDMSFIRKIHVHDPVSPRRGYARRPALIGTVSPSLNGEKLYVQTKGSFQIVDVATGAPDYTRDFFFDHVCFNHMQTAKDTGWA